jgi:hypothetical protein
MTNTIGPALAFYLRHGTTCNMLRELGGAEGRLPQGIAEDDWRKFLDVMERASKQIGPWLDSAREEGVGVLKERVDVSARSHTAARDWSTWATLKVKPNRGLKALHLCVSLDAYPESEGGNARPCVFIPSLAVDGGDPARRDLQERLVDSGLSGVAQGPDWFGSHTILLSVLPVTPESDMDALTRESTACFARLAEVWPRVFA